MPQLQINQGPQDALLYDNTKSYFTNVGYVRTSNFQLELRDVDPQNSANLGTTVQFVIPKAADLLGPTDLRIEFAEPSNAAVESTYAAWVESVGYAMIERITFSVGSHDIETITGDQLNIMNELMKSDEQRLGNKQLLKTGRGAVSHAVTAATAYSTRADVVNGRLIQQYPTSGSSVTYDGKKLIIPLGLFFTKHPSQYFPLAAIAGCNDVRIAVKFRTLPELVVLGHTNYTCASNALDKDGTTPPATPAMPTFASSVLKECKLRCHYIHVTGPEATTLMNKEHVRLLKLFQVNSKPFTIGGGSATAAATTSKGKLVELDLSFLHPVQELIITIRKASEMSSSTGVPASAKAKDQLAMAKNYFAYHGGGKDPNVESLVNRTTSLAGAAAGGVSGHIETGFTNNFLTVMDFKLTLNGQERHPSLASSGLDREYLMDRLMPMLHSNTSHLFTDVSTGAIHDGSELDFAHLGEMLDRKEIYVYPFALNPEGSNPSGAVNFSKVSHAKLQIEGTADFSTGHTSEEYVCDVYGIYYNWLQIKDGRALTSFA